MSQRPRHEYAAGFPRGLPRPLLNTVVEVLAAPSDDETHRARPRSARFEPVSGLKDVVTPVPRVLLFVSLAEHYARIIADDGVVVDLVDVA